MASSVDLVMMGEPLCAMTRLKYFCEPLTSTTGRLAENGHVVGVTAEGCDVLMHPLQGHQLVHCAQILCVGIILAIRQMRQMHEAVCSEPVSDGDHDDIRILRDEIGAVVLWVYCSACLEAAAVDPHHDWFFLRSHFIIFPHIQVQAVLALKVKGSRVALRLDRSLPIIMDLIDTIIGNVVHRCLPAQAADRLLTDKRNAQVIYDIISLLAYEGSIDAFDSQRMVIIAVCNLFVPFVCPFFFRICRHRIVIFGNARSEHHCRAANQDGSKHP